MAHSRLNFNAMFDWIERCLDDGSAMPADAEIMDRFGFASSESARTLLAELADAGKISIKGYGASRTITLGRRKSELVAAGRPEPAVAKADPVVERTVARIAEIVQRGRAPQPSPAQQAPSAPPPNTESKDMPASKSITFVATGHVLEEIKRRTADGTPNNRVALELVEAAIAAGEAAPQPIMTSPTIQLDLRAIEQHRLINELVRRLESAGAGERLEATVRDLAAANDRAEAADQRARDADQRARDAEAKLASIRAAIG